MRNLTITDDPALRGLPDHLVVSHRATAAEVESTLSRTPLIQYDTIRISAIHDLSHWKTGAESMYILQNTNIKDSERWCDEAFANLPYLARAPDAAILSGSLRGRTLVFCAAGPSLDEHYAYLRSFGDSITILAVNTAAGALWKNGIKADIVIAADPRDTTFLGVSEMDTTGVLLVEGWFANRQIARRFDNICTWTNNSAITRGIYSMLRRPMTTQFTERGSVVGCAYDLIDLLDPSEVYILGQDLVISGDTSYAKDAFYTTHGRAKDKHETDTICNDGVMRPTTRLFKTYIDTVNQALSQWKRPIYNLSLTGAKYDKVPYRENISALSGSSRPCLTVPKLGITLDGLGQAMTYFMDVSRLCAETNYPLPKRAARVERMLDSDLVLASLLTAAGFRNEVLHARPQGRFGIEECYLNIIKKEADAYTRRLREILV